MVRFELVDPSPRLGRGWCAAAPPKIPAAASAGGPVVGCDLLRAVT